MLQAPSDKCVRLHQVRGRQIPPVAIPGHVSSPKCGPEQPPHALHFGAGDKRIQGDAGEGDSCAGRAISSRNMAGTSARPSASMPTSAAGGIARSAGSTMTRTAAKPGDAPLRAWRRRAIPYRRRRRRYSRCRFALDCRFRNRIIHAEDRRIAGSWDWVQEFVGPRLIRDVACLRFDEADATTQSPGRRLDAKPSGDTEADDAAIAVSRRVFGCGDPIRVWRCGRKPRRQVRRRSLASKGMPTNAMTCGGVSWSVRGSAAT